MTNYSQNEEQRYILEACANVSRKRLLDIGAWDPLTFSNSRALIELGWEAVLVEPSPRPLAKLIREYGSSDRVTVVGAAIALTRAPLKLHVTDDGVTGNNSEQWKDAGGFYGWMITNPVLLEDILTWWDGFDFVSIDTEGLSVDLLKALLATEMMPQCICVEHDNRIVEAAQAAHARGYKQIYASGENLVFAR